MSKPNSSNDKIKNRPIPFDPDSLIFVLPLSALLALGAAWGWLWLWIPCAVLIFCILMFFRDPARNLPDDPNAIVSPADGKVVGITKNEDPEKGPVPGTQVTIFLSVLNCHINRAPWRGTVEKIRYQKGLFLNALDPVSNERNECNWVYFKDGERRFTVRQIAGLIARRIVCRVKEGQEIARGERIGLIRFGSRTELYLPADCEIVATVGQNIKGARDVIARFKSGD